MLWPLGLVLRLLCLTHVDFKSLKDLGVFLLLCGRKRVTSACPRSTLSAIATIGYGKCLTWTLRNACLQCALVCSSFETEGLWENYKLFVLKSQVGLFRFPMKTVRNVRARRMVIKGCDPSLSVSWTKSLVFCKK